MTDQVTEKELGLNEMAVNGSAYFNSMTLPDDLLSLASTEAELSEEDMAAIWAAIPGMGSEEITLTPALVEPTTPTLTVDDWIAMLSSEGFNLPLDEEYAPPVDWQRGADLAYASDEGINRDVPPLERYEELLALGQALARTTQDINEAFVMTDLEIREALIPGVSEGTMIEGFDPAAYRDGIYDPQANALLVVTVDQGDLDNPDDALLGVMKFTRDEAGVLQVGLYPVGAGLYANMQAEGQRLDAIFKEQGLEAGKEESRTMNETLMQSQAIDLSQPDLEPAASAPSFSGPSLY